MMTIKFKDKTEIVVTDEQGQKIQDKIVEGAEFIRLNGELYSRSSIGQVVAGGEEPRYAMDDWVPKGNLSVGPKCVGKKSIQREINNIAKSDHPKNWSKKIRDNKWREATRQKLLSVSDDWCDYKASKCVCKVAV